MTKELKEAIEALYSTYAIYAFRPTMEGCPCCVSHSDKEQLHSKNLRELNGDDLERYAFKALSTWGDINDFKHYLPRIFELLATTDFPVDTFVVLGKLEYGKWKTWPEEQQHSILKYLLAWWLDLIQHRTFNSEIFIEIYKLIDSVEELLSRWRIHFDDNSFFNYVEFVHDFYHDLKNKNAAFRALDKASVDQLVEWVNDNAQHLEPGFFHYEKIDKDFAEKISTTLYIFERVK